MMQKSYVTKSPINFVEFNFRVNAGDVLVHDSASQKLTVYRSGAIIKVLKQTSLGMSALLKNRFVSEVEVHAAQPTKDEIIHMLKNVPKIKPDPKPAPKKEEPKKLSKEEIEQKRKKAVPTEIVGEENYPPRLKEALAKHPPIKIEIEDEKAETRS